MLLGDKHKTNPVGLEDSIQNIEEEEPEEASSSKSEEKPRKCSERFKMNTQKVTPSRQSEPSQRNSTRSRIKEGRI